MRTIVDIMSIVFACATFVLPNEVAVMCKVAIPPIMMIVFFAWRATVVIGGTVLGRVRGIDPIGE